MLKIYITGLLILVSAIVINVISQAIGLLGWYGFLTRLAEEGRLALKSIRLLDYVWLFFGYPFLLGLTVWLADRWLNR